jgi:hypothetical protein
LLLCLLVSASPDLKVYRSLFSFSEISIFFLFFLGCAFHLYVGLVFTFFRPFSGGGRSVPWCFPARALDLEVWFGFRSSCFVLGVFLFFRIRGIGRFRSSGTVPVRQREWVCFGFGGTGSEVEATGFGYWFR